MPEQCPRVRAAHAAETVVGGTRSAQWRASYCDAAQADITVTVTVRLYSVVRFETACASEHQREKLHGCGGLNTCGTCDCMGVQLAIPQLQKSTKISLKAQNSHRGFENYFFFFFVCVLENKKKASLFDLFSRDACVEKKTFAGQKTVRLMQEATTLGGISTQSIAKTAKKRKQRKEETVSGCRQPLTENVVRDSSFLSPLCHGGVCSGVRTLQLARSDARSTG